MLQDSAYVTLTLMGKCTCVTNSQRYNCIQFFEEMTGLRCAGMQLQAEVNGHSGSVKLSPENSSSIY